MSAKKISVLSSTPAKIEPLIHEIRGERVIMDSDLARIYSVPTLRLNEAVKRNARRFPEDFVFQLTEVEWRSIGAVESPRNPQEDRPNLISQIAISSRAHGGRRTLPFVFTEHGALMAANILKSGRAEDMSVLCNPCFCTNEAGAC